MEGFDASPSFCTTWNQAGQGLGQTSPPVENAVETADPILARLSAPGRLTLEPGYPVGRKLLTLHTLAAFFDCSEYQP